VEGAAQCLQVSAARRPSAQRQMRSGWKRLARNGGDFAQCAPFGNNPRW
jgi:hypothetical protein